MSWSFFFWTVAWNEEQALIFTRLAHVFIFVSSFSQEASSFLSRNTSQSELLSFLEHPVTIPGNYTHPLTISLFLFNRKTDFVPKKENFQRWIHLSRVEQAKEGKTPELLPCKFFFKLQRLLSVLSWKKSVSKPYTFFDIQHGQVECHARDHQCWG